MGLLVGLKYSTIYKNIVFWHDVMLDIITHFITFFINVVGSSPPPLPQKARRLT